MTDLSAFDRVIAKAKNLSPAMRQIGDWWKTTESERMFNQQSDPYQKGWQPLKEGYRRYKLSKGLDGRIGRKSGSTYAARSYSVSGNKVTLRISTKQAAYFDRRRLLFPKGTLPQHWREQIAKDVGKHIRG